MKKSTFCVYDGKFDWGMIAMLFVLMTYQVSVDDVILYGNIQTETMSIHRRICQYMSDSLRFHSDRGSQQIMRHLLIASDFHRMRIWKRVSCLWWFIYFWLFYHAPNRNRTYYSAIMSTEKWLFYHLLPRSPERKNEIFKLCVMVWDSEQH